MAIIVTKMGAFDYIVKPPELEYMLATAKRALGSTKSA
jgi:DNA-binding NtrC family response regulator